MGVDHAKSLEEEGVRLDFETIAAGLVPDSVRRL
jgi:hypothetical protein